MQISVHLLDTILSSLVKRKPWTDHLQLETRVFMAALGMIHEERHDHLIVVEEFACLNDPRSSVVWGFMPFLGPSMGHRS